MPKVAKQYHVEVETEHGVLTFDVVAMSSEQIRLMMPPEVARYVATFVRDRPEVPEFGTQDEDSVEFQLWYELCTAVRNLETTAEMTAEWLAENRSRQKQAMDMLRGTVCTLEAQPLMQAIERRYPAK